MGSFNLVDQMSVSDDRIVGEILRQCRARGPGKTVSLSQVARALIPDEAAWRTLMQQIRTVAAKLADAGQIVVTQKGVVIEPKEPRGPIRLGIVTVT